MFVSVDLRAPDEDADHGADRGVESLVLLRRGIFLRPELHDLIEDRLALLPSGDMAGVLHERIHRGEGEGTGNAALGFGDIRDYIIDQVSHKAGILQSWVVV